MYKRVVEKKTILHNIKGTWTKVIVHFPKLSTTLFLFSIFGFQNCN